AASRLWPAVGAPARFGSTLPGIPEGTPIGPDSTGSAASSGRAVGAASHEFVATSASGVTGGGVKGSAGSAASGGARTASASASADPATKNPPALPPPSPPSPGANRIAGGASDHR